MEYEIENKSGIAKPFTLESGKTVLVKDGEWICLKLARELSDDEIKAFKKRKITCSKKSDEKQSTSKK